MRSLIAILFFLALNTGVAQQSKEDSLRVLIKSSSLDSSKVKALLALHDELRLSNFNEAAELARESFSLANDLKWNKGIALSGRNLGIALSLLGKYDSAVAILNLAIEKSASINDQSNIGYCQMTLGNIQYDQTNYDQALKYYFECLKTYEGIENYAGMSSAMIWIGIIYQYSKSDYAAAIAAYEEALTLAERGNSGLNKGYVYGNLAIIYDDRAVYDSAIYYNKKSMGIKEQYNDRRGVGNSLNNIGNVFYSMSQLDSAILYYSNSLVIRREINDQTGIVSASINLGRIFLDQRQFQRAEDLLSAAKSLAEELNYKEAWKDAMFHLSVLYESTGRLKEALSFFKQYKSLSDSIFNIESDKGISELQVTFETEKKEQQIALQKAEIAEQKAQNRFNFAVIVGLVLIVLLLGTLMLSIRSRSRRKQTMIRQELEIEMRESQIEASIASQEKERSRYAKDLHDGFGQMISILNLNLKSLENNPESRESVFEESAKVLEEMYQELKGICFNLMPQTLIKNGISPAINEFASRINVSGKVFVETDFFGLEERLIEIQEISLYRITQEWVNNILKYSDADKINIQITKDEEELTLLIEDNGSGFDSNLLQSGKGNGWRNMNSRANLIKGELELDTTLGMKGNALIVNAPLLIQKPIVELKPS